MRVTLFTDTLGDINGVSRFIRSAADSANRSGRDLHVITSTRYPCPPWPNIFNFAPLLAMKMPRYENLDLCLPPLFKVLAHVRRHRPDAIHISTPGPVGAAGVLAARTLGIPVLGVYHTDFPAYIDRLFDRPAITRLTQCAMRAFYRRFRRVFTRSADYVESLAALGLPRNRLVPLTPGVDISAFHPRFADRQVWRDHGMDPLTFKALYVGRLSVEKNLPLLAALWRQVRAASGTLHSDARSTLDLVIVGDGPYRATMQRELSGLDVHFLGFRHGEELSRLYASSDLFLFPSVTDTLGQVVMEAQASGVPVFVADRGGPQEVVAHNQTGLVLPPDPSTWARAIVQITGDGIQRRRWGAAAFESMQSRSIAQSFVHFWQVHLEACQPHATPSRTVIRPVGAPLPTPSVLVQRDFASTVVGD